MSGSMVELLRYCTVCSFSACVVRFVGVGFLAERALCGFLARGKSRLVLRMGGLAFRIGRGKVRQDVMRGVDFGMRSKRVLIVANPGKNNGSALTGILVKVSRTDTKRVVLSKASVDSCSVGRETRTKVNCTFRRPPHFGKVAMDGLLSLTTKRSLAESIYYELLDAIKLYTGRCVRHRMSKALSNNRVGHLRVTAILTGPRGLYVFSRPRTKVSL